MDASSITCPRIASSWPSKSTRLSFGIPTSFQTQIREGLNFRAHYVPSSDGERFLINTAIDTPPSPITVVVNWTANLKK